MTLRVDPISGLLDSIQGCLAVVDIQPATETLRVTELGFGAAGVGRVEGFDALLLGFVNDGKLLSLGNHTVNLFLSERPLLVSDDD